MKLSALSWLCVLSHGLSFPSNTFLGLSGTSASLFYFFLCLLAFFYEPLVCAKN